MRALLLLVLLGSTASAATPIDPCKLPNASVTDCADNYMPHAIQSPPSANDKAAIQALIDAGKLALVDEDLKRAVYAKARVAAERHHELTPSDAQKAVTAYATATADLKNAKIATQRAFDKAIAETVRIYGLTPPVTDFSQDTRLREQLRARNSWAPRYSQAEFEDPQTKVMRRRTREEREALNKELDQKARDLGMTTKPKPAAGYTTHDTGEMHILLDAFQNPDHLAALIHHETIHWVDLMAIDGKVYLPEQKYRLEARAYARQAQAYAALGMTAEAQNTAAIRDQYLKQEAEAKKNHLDYPKIRVNPVYRRWLEGSLPNDVSGPDGRESVKSGGEDKFLEDLERLRGISDEARTTARKLVEAEQAERAARQKREHAAFMKRLAAEEEERRAAYRYIKTAAGLACADPESFARQAQGGAVVSAWVDELHFSAYLSQDINATGWKSIGVSPNDCQREVMKKIIYARAPVGSSDIAWWARAYRNAHPSLLKRFTTSIGEFFESKGGYETERERVDSTPNPRSEPEQRESPSRPSSGNGYRDGQAFGQARGIDATKMWRNQ